MHSFTDSLIERPLFLNKFNPTLKLICVILLLVLVFLPVTVIGQASIFILVVSLWISARLPKRKMKPILWTVGILFFFIFLINWLVAKDPGLRFDLVNHYELWGTDWMGLAKSGNIKLYDNYYWTHGQIWGGWVADNLTSVKPTGSYSTVNVGDTTLYLSYYAPLYALSSQVVITSVSMSVKIFCMLTVFSLLINTTSTMQLTYAFEHVLWPLKWIKVPVTEISYIISVAIGFVPTLLNEANKIINAQASKGLDFRNGHLITKVKAVVSLVVPMFAASFDYADKLSDAVEARNFVPRAKRTKYRVYHCSWGNWALFAILICLLALFIYLNVRKVIIYPTLAVDCFNI